MAKKYISNLAETSNVKLPDERLPLIEEMSKNVHEIWAKNRLSEVWTYGPVRNDAKKETPCMVAYEDLPFPNERSPRPGLLHLPARQIRLKI